MYVCDYLRDRESERERKDVFESVCVFGRDNIFL